MVYLVNVDSKWKPTNGGKVKIRGAFWYEKATELGPMRVDIPLEEVRLIKEKGKIEPRENYEIERGSVRYEPVPLMEAMREAKDKGADFMWLSALDNATYFLYKHCVNSKGRSLNSNSILRYNIDKARNMLVTIVHKKDAVSLDDLELVCSIPVFDYGGKRRKIAELKDIAFEADGDLLVGGYKDVGEKKPWVVYRWKR